MTRKLFIGLVIIVMSLTGCNLPASSSTSNEGAASRAWFDAPLPETVVRPPNPCQIVAHGASPNGIAVFELTINGNATSIPSPDTNDSLVTLTRNCNLSEPGRYVLLMRVQDNAGNWSGYAETSLIIAGGETPSIPPPLEPLSTIPPDATLTPSATAAQTGGVSIERISDDLIYVGASSCGPTEVTITVRATAPNGIQVVVLFYRFSSSSSSEFQSISMNPIGNDLYQRTLSMSSIFGSAIPFDQATLQYQIVVQQVGGDTSIRTPVMADIAVQACGSATSACSSYPDKRACEAHGCRWVGSGTSYSCQP